MYNANINQTTYIVMNPTNELYAPLIEAYNHFNSALFENKLPNVIFTLQRKKGVLGFFSAKRWGNTKGNYCSEIAINPAYFANSRMIEVLQTLVHEMVHCWQFCYGKPNNVHYHNMEWAKKMISVGLMPSTTGEPGGKITGKGMSDFIIKDGKFMSLVTELLGGDNFHLMWVDRYSLPKLFDPVIADTALNDTQLVEQTGNPDSIEFENIEYLSDYEGQETTVASEIAAQNLPETFLIQEVAKKQTRTRYICPNCETKLYGKMHLNIVCGDCNNRFISDN
ncbi:SprT-like domain-containing protein [Colwelliaceae bacterium 6441]